MKSFSGHKCVCKSRVLRVVRRAPKNLGVKENQCDAGAVKMFIAVVFDVLWSILLTAFGEKTSTVPISVKHAQMHLPDLIYNKTSLVLVGN